MATKRFGAISSTRLNNYTATVAPTPTDDAGDGYALGSIWVDTVAKSAYICVDPTTSAAVWKPLTGPPGFGGITGAFGPGLHTVVPRCVLDINTDTGQASNTTTGEVGMIECTAQIDVARIAIAISTAGAAGATVRIAIYSLDGQTKLIDITVAATSTGEINGAVSPAVLLAPGLYYVFHCRADASGGTNPTIRTYGVGVGLPHQPAGSLAVTSGTLVVVAGAAPANFDPTTLTPSASRCLMLRLDAA